MPATTDAADRWRGAICSDYYNPDVFFPNPGRPPNNPPYRQMCNRCPIQQFCKEYGIVHQEIGVWGGLTQSERELLPAYVRVQLIQKAKREGWFEYRKSVDEIVEEILGHGTTNRNVGRKPEKTVAQTASAVVPPSEPVLFDFEIFRFDFEMSS